MLATKTEHKIVVGSTKIRIQSTIFSDSSNDLSSVSFVLCCLFSPGDLELGALCDGLQSLRSEVGDSRLTSRTQKLLMFNDRQEAQVSTKQKKHDAF